ncbi:MAG: RNA polymerase sigma factor [Mangrovibacterium sp.]
MSSKRELPNWNQIYKTEAPKLIATCRRYVKDHALAEDLAQESMLKAIDRYDSFRAESELGAWLRRIAINEALMYLRKSQTEPIELSKRLPELDGDEMLQFDWSIDELLAAIDSLPVQHRTVFNLYVLDEYKHKQVAEMLDISENTSKSHLLRARILLQAKLEAMAKEKEKKQRLAGAFVFTSTSPIDELFRQKLGKYQVAPQRAFHVPKIKGGGISNVHTTKTHQAQQRQRVMNPTDFGSKFNRV